MNTRNNEMITKTGCWIEVLKSIYLDEIVVRIIIDKKDRCMIVNMTDNERKQLRKMLAIQDSSNIEHIHKQIKILKSLHRQMIYADRSGYVCESCNENWPCRTITVIRDLEKT